MTDLLTPEAVAEMLGCTTDTINDKLARHELPGIKLGRAWRLPAGALMQHLEGEAMRHVQEPKPSEVRAVLQDYAEALAELPARVMVEAHRITEQRIHEILSGRPRPGDVQVVKAC